MKFWNIRVIEADSQEEAIEKLENGEFDESDENCDRVIPEIKSALLEFTQPTNEKP
jgi:hypothetical protein